MTALVKLGGLLLIISLAKSTERHGKFSVFQVVEFPVNELAHFESLDFGY